MKFDAEVAWGKRSIITAEKSRENGSIRLLGRYAVRDTLNIHLVSHFGNSDAPTHSQETSCIELDHK